MCGIRDKRPVATARGSAKFRQSRLGLDRERLGESPCKVSLCFGLTPADLVEHMSDIYIHGWQDLALQRCPKPPVLPLFVRPSFLHYAAEEDAVPWLAGRDGALAHSCHRYEKR